MARERKATLKPTRVRDRRAAAAIMQLAGRAARAMSYDVEVVVTLRTRPVRKLKGRITRRAIRNGWKATGRDGESSLEIDIAGETVPLEGVLSIERLDAGAPLV